MPIPHFKMPSYTYHGKRGGSRYDNHMTHMMHIAQHELGRMMECVNGGQELQVERRHES